MSLSILCSALSRQLFTTVVPVSAACPTIVNVSNFGSSSTPSPSQAKSSLLPKRPLSAYFVFASEKRPECPKTSVVETAKLLGQKWGQLPENQKQAYFDKSRKELSAWREQTIAIKEKFGDTPEFKEQETERKVRKLNKALEKLEENRKQLLKETEMPKKPTQPYVLFVKAKYGELKADPNIKPTNIFQAISKEWMALPEDKKAVYVAESEKQKKDYLRAKTKWDKELYKSGKFEELKRLIQKIKDVKEQKKNV